VVDRYLASRGTSVAAQAPRPVASVAANVVDRFLATRGGSVAAQAVVASSVIPNVSAQVVDRFLGRRGASDFKSEFG
jgi:hypothetical protein